jgi:hypothetical protein
MRRIEPVVRPGCISDVMLVQPPGGRGRRPDQPLRQRVSAEYPGWPVVRPEEIQRDAVIYLSIENTGAENTGTP